VLYKHSTNDVFDRAASMSTEHISDKSRVRDTGVLYKHSTNDVFDRAASMSTEHISDKSRVGDTGVLYKHFEMMFSGCSKALKLTLCVVNADVSHNAEIPTSLISLFFLLILICM
jgi:hypothetical protein